MRVLLVGATGFIGRALTLRLLRDGHEVLAAVRSGGAALGPGVTLVALNDDAALHAALQTCDGVINLAGAPILGPRWSPARRRELVDSRVGLTERLARALVAAERPRVFVTGSAVGYYGDAGDHSLDESSPAGDDFLAALCRDWEAASGAASDAGVRTVQLRVGVVLGREGGALAKMLPAFRVGLGGRLGSGSQYLPWIHLEDLVDLFARALTDPSLSGPINGTAPTPVTNRAFTRALGAALGRPAALAVPTAALRVLFGEAADVLLTGQRAHPTRALAAGFEFRFPTLEAALEDLLGDAGVELGPAGAVEPVDYLIARRPRRELRARVLLDAPLDEVFEFFSRAENLGVITPPTLTFEMRSPPPDRMAAGVELAYRIRLGPFPMGWVTRIESFEPGARFTDSQQRGPYACWWHEHTFEAEGAQTWMTDRVLFSAPLGPFGRLSERVFVEPMLRRIFGYRTAAMRLRFGMK